MDLRNGPKTNFHSHIDCRGIWKCLELHLHVKYEYAYMSLPIYIHTLYNDVYVYIHACNDISQSFPIYYKALQCIV